MNKYTIYHKVFAPTELVAKYPQHAKYYTDEFYLFVETLEQVKGESHHNISPLFMVNLVDDVSVGMDDLEVVNVSDETQITKSDLLVRVNAFLTSNAQDMEVQLSESQGKFIYNEIFKENERQITA